MQTKIYDINVANTGVDPHEAALLDTTVRHFMSIVGTDAWSAVVNVAEHLGQAPFTILMELHQAKNLVEKAEKLRRAKTRRSKTRRPKTKS